MWVILKRALVGALIIGMLGMLFSPALTPVSYAAKSNISNLEQKRRSNQQELKRIRNLKRQIMLKEKHVTYNILQNQKRLESSRDSLSHQQALMEQTRVQLVSLSKELDIALAEQQRLEAEVGKRLKNLYMGERLSFLHMLLSSGNLSSLLDRMYYKKRVFAQDKELYADYIAKTQILEDKKNALLKEKNQLAQTIRNIQSYQNQLRESVTLDRLLVQKLQTSREAYDMAENQLEQESFNIERQILALTRTGGAVIGSTGQFIRPVIAAMTSQFGFRVHPIFRTRRFHSGTDFGAAYGTPIRAADGGRVIHAGWQGGYGKVVIINHGAQGGRNLSTLYAHMSSIGVSAGQQISKGQVIGRVGSTGYSTGAHLHFEVRENGRPINPLGFLR